jgi:hypothetical protein
MATSYAQDLAAVGIEALAGPPREISEKLNAVDADQNDEIFALKLHQVDKRYAKALFDTIRVIAPMIVGELAIREKATLEKLVDVLVPLVPPPEHLLAEARMNAEARTAVFESADWLTAAQLSDIAGFSGQNASAQPNRWKREGKIFALRRNGSDYYPGYALDPDAHYRPTPGLAPVLAVFGDELEDWDIAIWFASANSFLGGAAPKDLLLSAPDNVLAAAKDEMVGVLHG